MNLYLRCDNTRFVARVVRMVGAKVTSIYSEGNISQGRIRCGNTVNFEFSTAYKCTRYLVDSHGDTFHQLIFVSGTVPGP